MHAQARSRWHWLVLAGLFLVGCAPAKYPVKGHVIFKEDGKPLTGGQVVFEPADMSLVYGATGDIQPDGSYRMGTDGVGDGVREGVYRVLVVPPFVPQVDETKAPKAIIH